MYSVLKQNRNVHRRLIFCAQKILNYLISEIDQIELIHIAALYILLWLSHRELQEAMQDTGDLIQPLLGLQQVMPIHFQVYL